MGKAKKAICIAMALSCFLGASSFTAVNAHAAKSQGKEVINTKSGRSELVTLDGVLVVSHIYYIVAPGPNDPVYSYSIRTKSGKTYYINTPGYAGDELAKYNGEEITIVGIVNSSSPSYINILDYMV